MSVRILALTLGSFAVNTGAYLATGMLSDIASSTGVSTAAAGQLVAVYALTYAAAAPVLSALLDHLDRRALLLAALALCCAGNLLTAAAPGFDLLLAARVVAAVGASLFTPIAVVMAADLVPVHRRASAVAAVVTGSTLATVLGVPAGVLLADSVGFRGAYLAVAAAGAAASLAMLALPRTSRMPRMPLRGRFTVLADPAVLAVLGVALLASLSDFTPYTFVVPMLGDHGGLDAASVSGLLVAYGLAGLVGNTLSGWAADRFGTGRAASAALAALVLGLALMPLAGGSLALTAAAAVLWGLGGWGVLPPLQARLIELAPAAAGAVVALNVSVVWFGMGLGGVLGGTVIDTAGLGGLAPAGAGLAVAAGAVLAVSARQRRTARAASVPAARAEAAAPAEAAPAQV
ncbi:MFS transporter [Nocardiopsis coralliicola]